MLSIGIIEDGADDEENAENDQTITSPIHEYQRQVSSLNNNGLVDQSAEASSVKATTVLLEDAQTPNRTPSPHLPKNRVSPTEFEVVNMRDDSPNKGQQIKAIAKVCT